jgi:hypothetical protein
LAARSFQVEPKQIKQNSSRRKIDMSIKARMRVNERMICAEGIELATEVFGHPAHPPVLMIMEALCRP